MRTAITAPQSHFDRRWLDGPVGNKTHASAILREKQWEGQSCFIIGGGPSLQNFDFSLLDGQNTIAINRAFYDVPDPSIVFGCDYRFVEWVESGKYDKDCPGASQKWADLKCPKVWLDLFNSPMNDIYYLRSPGLSGISTNLEEGLYHGNNSGFAAIQLALVLGAYPIYLLGFDQHFTHDGKAHYHQGHPEPDPLFTFDNMLPYFKEFSHTEASDRVINLTLDSSLHGVIQYGDFPLDVEPVFVSFYTVGTPYEDEIRVLEAGLFAHNLRYHFGALGSRGDWMANCAMKPRFILDCMLKFWPRPVVWLDADSEVLVRPDILMDTRLWDVAFHTFKWPHGKEVSSAVVGLKNTSAVRALVQDWIDEMENYLVGYDYDQRVFKRVIDKYKDGDLNILDLPPQYDQIFDLMHDVKDPVIRQNQASRRFRHLIGKEETK